MPSYPFSLRGTEVPLRVSVFINTSIVVCTYPVPYQLIATVPRSVSQKVQATEAQPRSGEVSSGAKSAGQTRVDQKRKCYCLDPEPRIRGWAPQLVSVASDALGRGRHRLLFSPTHHPPSGALRFDSYWTDLDLYIRANSQELEGLSLRHHSLARLGSLVGMDVILAPPTLSQPTTPNQRNARGH